MQTMSNEIKKTITNKRFILPALVGVSVAGAITYFLTSKQTAELRQQLADNIGQKWGALKEKISSDAPEEELTEDSDAVTE